MIELLHHQYTQYVITSLIIELIKIINKSIMGYIYKIIVPHARDFRFEKHLHGPSNLIELVLLQNN